MWSWVVALLFPFMFNHPLLVEGNAVAWGNNCPIACTCHTSRFGELPMQRWLEEESTNEKPERIPAHYNNNVLYTEDGEQPKNIGNLTNEMVRTAMCVFQHGTEPKILIGQLPEDIQVLTILQSPGSGEITLEADHLKRLQDLIVLDIQGFHHEASSEQQKNNTPPSDKMNTKNPNGQLVLRNDALQPLVSLKYLSLQHIKLMGHHRLGNRAAPEMPPVLHVDPVSNDIPVMFNSEPKISKGKGKKGKEDTPHVVFLPPADDQGEILPYKMYVEEQQRAGLSTFSGLANLIFLQVFDCGLKEINWEMFESLNNLQYLSLEKNELLFIPDFAFYGTPNLKILSLAHNKLLSLQSTGLAGLLRLEKLDMSYNNFSHLSELSLPPFPKLHTADFRQNPIEEVFSSTFEIMNATKTLFIGSKESALNILPNSFLGLQSLLKLRIYNIDSAIMEREMLRGMPKLQDLQITGTIASISFDAFLEVPKIENLVLDNCKIQSISMDAFYGLYGLLYLDLSNNLLQSLPPGLFDQQFSLKELLLQNNQLTELPVGIFNTLPAKMIRLENNPWHCSCAMKDWQPAAINKVKQSSSAQCQFQYDKGSMCHIKSADRYIYERRVAPRCKTPAKYKNWSVFHVLRKEMRCSKKQHNKVNRKAYLKKKYEDYEKSIKPVYTLGKYKFQTKQTPHWLTQPANSTSLSSKAFPMSSDSNKTNSQEMSQHSANGSKTFFISENHTKPLQVSADSNSEGQFQNVQDTSERNFTYDMLHTVSANAKLLDTNRSAVTYLTPAHDAHSYPLANITSKDSNTTMLTDGTVTSAGELMDSVNKNKSLNNPAASSLTRHAVNSTKILTPIPHDFDKHKKLPDTSAEKYDQGITVEAVPTGNKKEKEKLELLNEKKQKVAMKEKMLMSEPGSATSMDIDTHSKMVKDAWKANLAKKRQEKLLKYQT